MAVLIMQSPSNGLIGAGCELVHTTNIYVYTYTSQNDVLGGNLSPKPLEAPQIHWFEG